MRFGITALLLSTLAFGFEDYGCVVSVDDEMVQHQVYKEPVILRAQPPLHTPIAPAARPIEIQPLDEQVADLRARVDEVTKENALLKKSVNLTSGNPYVVDKTWFFDADVLYWHANIDQTEYGARRSTNGNLVQVAPRTIGYDWNFGFKIGVGYYLDHDDWDLFLNTTYFRTRGEGTASSNTTVIPWRGNGISANATAPNFGKSVVDLKYNDLVAELGRSYFTSSKLSLRPHWGLKALWANIDQDSRFEGGDFGTATYRIENLSKMRGFGPRTGLNSSWYLFDRVSIIGNFAFSFIYNNFNLSHRHDQPSVTPQIVQESKHAFIPAADLYFGLGVGEYFNKRNYYLQAKLGFEMQYFWGMERYYYPYNADNTGATSTFMQYNDEIANVSLSGVTLRISFDY
ncbi:MAG: Lpg1974 family pore-forming outer membrane protein [Simkaniaceae bacterium]|nr:Lpg1974 family pore-forming outer membrane protein [Simkaniaceae bacterium]